MNFKERVSMPNSNRTKKRRKEKRSFMLPVSIAFLMLALTSLVIVSCEVVNDIKSDKEAEEIKIAETDTIYDNIYINDINIGGLKKDEALTKLENELNKTFSEEKIGFSHGNDLFEYIFTDFKAQYDIESAVNAAFEYGRKGEPKERLEKINNLVENPLKLTAEYAYDLNSVKEKASALSEAINKEPVNASLKRENGVFITTPEIAGIKVVEEDAVKAMVEFLDSKKGGSMSVPTAPVEAQYTEESFRKATQLIGTYQTKIAGGAAGRNQNIYTAADKINDYVVYPGEVFSTNAAFGEMTIANGYSMAPVIIGGVLEDGMGGGVCQVSSTLYIALLYAELDIVERQNHSQRVGYVPAAYDATLAGDYIDLKFKNNTDYPVTIETDITGNILTVNVYGYEIHNEGRRLEFYNTLVETVPPPAEEVVETEELPLGQKEVKVEALAGTKYNLYKIVYENDKEIAREKVNLSYYKPRRSIIRVGIGPEAPKSPEEEPSEVPQSTTQTPPEAVPEIPSDTPNHETPVEETEAPPIIE